MKVHQMVNLRKWHFCISQFGAKGPRRRHLQNPYKFVGLTIDLPSILFFLGKI